VGVLHGQLVRVPPGGVAEVVLALPPHRHGPVPRPAASSATAGRPGGRDGGGPAGGGQAAVGVVQPPAGGGVAVGRGGVAGGGGVGGGGRRRRGSFGRGSGSGWSHPVHVGQDGFFLH